MWLIFDLKSLAIAVITAVFAAMMGGCASAPQSGLARVETGFASYYSNQFEGRYTADGEVFDNSKLTAAHRTYPFGTIVRVTNLATDASVEVRINDRGPVKLERIIDLSEAAARAIGIEQAGLGRVKVEVIKWGG